MMIWVALSMVALPCALEKKIFDCSDLLCNKVVLCAFLIHRCQRLKDLINDNKFDTATKSAFGGIFLSI